MKTPCIFTSSLFNFFSFFISVYVCAVIYTQGARGSSVVRSFAHGVMGRRIDPSWDGAIELFLVPASAP